MIFISPGSAGRLTGFNEFIRKSRKQPKAGQEPGMHEAESFLLHREQFFVHLWRNLKKMSCKKAPE